MTTELGCRRCGQTGLVLTDSDAAAMVHYSNGEILPDGSTCYGPCVVAGWWGRRAEQIPASEQGELDRQETAAVIESAIMLGWTSPGIDEPTLRSLCDGYIGHEPPQLTVPDSVALLSAHEITETVLMWASVADAWLIENKQVQPYDYTEGCFVHTLTLKDYGHELSVGDLVALCGKLQAKLDTDRGFEPEPDDPRPYEDALVDLVSLALTAAGRGTNRVEIRMEIAKAAGEAANQ